MPLCKKTTQRSPLDELLTICVQMPAIDYNNSKSLLESEFAKVEAESLQGTYQQAEPSLIPHLDLIFHSKTQAYREVLLGCVIARLQDKTINIRKPYVKQGYDAYNGRTLDERVINPFLQDKRIPCSKGPFLSVFRRSVKFEEGTRDGVQDKKAFDAFLFLVDYIAREDRDAILLNFLRNLLFKSLELRQGAKITLSRLQRISIEQYDSLIAGLLSIQSGGRFPVILIEATFTAVRDSFGLSWQIECQGINVADSPSGAGGDLTVKDGGIILLAAEITERPVEKSKVITTFNTKIAPQGIEDYLFFVKAAEVEEQTKIQMRQYFSQGHEVNFLEIKNWILMTLATLGKKGRATFNRILLDRLSSEDIPSSLKVAWNKQIARITSVY